jgi:hypothetical protein
MIGARLVSQRCRCGKVLASVSFQQCAEKSLQVIPGRREAANPEFRKHAQAEHLDSGFAPQPSLRRLRKLACAAPRNDDLSLDQTQRLNARSLRFEPFSALRESLLRWHEAGHDVERPQRDPARSLFGTHGFQSSGICFSAAAIQYAHE